MRPIEYKPGTAIPLTDMQFKFLQGKCCSGHPNCRHDPHIPFSQVMPFKIKESRPSDSLAYKRITKEIFNINRRGWEEDSYEDGFLSGLLRAREILRKSMKEAK